jgi:2-C-methyl-D-erythritol 4-phosphate cytidylyltransferase
VNPSRPDSSAVAGIVVAGGAGSRFGGPKHDQMLGDRPLWRWGRDVLHSAGIENVVVVGPVPGGVPGGARRRDSVAAGLAAISSSPAYVLVHDAARPLTDVAVVRAVIERLLTGDVDGVVPGVPVRDTLKETDYEGLVTTTISRERLVAVQTPQGFVTSVLRQAHDLVAGDVTDDAGMVESIGGSIAVVPGDPRNIKVTYPEDLVVVRAMLGVEGS